MPLVAFVPLATADLYCIYRELKATQLKTINRETPPDRRRVVREAETPAFFKTVAAPIRLFFPARLDESTLPLRVTGLAAACPTARTLADALRDDPTTPYVLAYLFRARRSGKKPSPRATGWLAVSRRHRADNVVVSRNETRARSADTKKKKQKERGKATRRWRSRRTPRAGTSCRRCCRWRTCARCRSTDLDKRARREWALGEPSESRAPVRRVRRAIFQNGWLAGKVLLSSAERAPYRVAGEVVRERAYARNGNESGGRGGSVKRDSFG